MKTSKLTALTAAVAAALLFNAAPVSAQDAPPPPPDASAAPAPSTSGTSAAPNPGGADRQQQFRQRMNEMLKTTLKASDEEWSVIQPLLEKVQTKLHEANGGRVAFGGRRGPGGAGPGAAHGAAGPDGAQSAIRPPRPQFNHSPESADLQAALESENTSADTIKAKLEAVREARKKANADLDQARQDLAKVLTQRQEATLVLMGILQ